VPYIPQSQHEYPPFTPLTFEDLANHLRLIKEKYDRHMPLIEWLPLQHTPTPAIDNDGEALVSGSGAPATNTYIDPLYGEAIPVNTSSQFVTPHGSDDDALGVNGASRKRYADSVWIRADVKPEEPEDDLTEAAKRGRRNLRVLLATTILDEQNLVVREGDRFLYRGVLYEVKEAFTPADAYWLRHTTVPLYVECKASVRREGS
jgi:hypothetical protein